MKCDQCGGRVATPSRQGRIARFCSNACRQKAYRRRRSDAGIPEPMRSADRWMRYRLVPRGDRMTKEPTQVNGRRASSTDERTWSSFVEAKGSNVGAGLGFALGNGIGCIDLDGAVVDGAITSWAQDVLDANPGTFTEVSQSGTGIHVWGLLPEAKGRVIRDGRNIEIYSSGRFIALGKPMEGSSAQLAPLVIPE